MTASSLPADSEASENIDFDSMMHNIFKTPSMDSSNPPVIDCEVDEFLSNG